MCSALLRCWYVYMYSGTPFALSSASGDMYRKLPEQRVKVVMWGSKDLLLHSSASKQAASSGCKCRRGELNTVVDLTHALLFTILNPCICVVCLYILSFLCVHTLFSTELFQEDLELCWVSLHNWCYLRIHTAADSHQWQLWCTCSSYTLSTYTYNVHVYENTQRFSTN